MSRCGRVSKALRQPGESERDQHHADRHVDPEDPVPVDRLGDRAAKHRARWRPQSPPIAPQIPMAPLRFSDGKAALTKRQGQRQRPWPHRRPGRPGRRSGLPTDGDIAAAAEAAVKTARPTAVHPAPAEAVTQRGAGQQQAGEGQQL